MRVKRTIAVGVIGTALTATTFIVGGGVANATTTWNPTQGCPVVWQTVVVPVPDPNSLPIAARPALPGTGDNLAEAIIAVGTDYHAGGQSPGEGVCVEATPGVGAGAVLSDGGDFVFTIPGGEIALP